MIGVGAADDDRPAEARARRTGEDSDIVEFEIPKRRQVESEGMPLAIIPAHGACLKDKDGTRVVTDRILTMRMEV